MEMVRLEGGSKVSQIIRITLTIAPFETYEGSMKSVKSSQMVSFMRWLNGDGRVGGRGGGFKSVKKKVS